MTILAPGPPCVPAGTAPELAPRLRARLRNETLARELTDATGLAVGVRTIDSGHLALVARMPDDEDATGPSLRITSRGGQLPLDEDGSFRDGVRVETRRADRYPVPPMVWEPFGLSSAPALTVAVRSILTGWQREQLAERPDDTDDVDA